MMPSRSLSGKKLITALEHRFPLGYFQHLHHIGEAEMDFEITYYWCSALFEFIEFLKVRMRVQSQKTFHDALKFFLRTLLASKDFRYEFYENCIYLDLLENLEKGNDKGPTRGHEVKTVEIITFEMFEHKFNKFLGKILAESPRRQSWWFIYLRECKVINDRRCYKFLGLIHLDADRIRNRLENLKWRKEFVQKVRVNMQRAEQRIIAQEQILPEELVEEGLFGVENQITYSLRADIIALIADNEAKDSEIASNKAKMVTDKAEMAADKAEIARLKGLLEKNAKK